MKILLINPPVWTNHQPCHFPLGLGYIYMSIKKYYTCDMLDIDGYRYSKKYVENYLKDNKYDIIGIGGLPTSYAYLNWLIPKIKEYNSNAKIIIGGFTANTLKDKLFKRFNVDYLVLGEGEITIVELLKGLQESSNLNEIKGIAFKKDNNIIFTLSRDEMDLTNISFFNDRPFPTTKLLKNSKGGLHIHCQRGCIGRCTFCFHHFKKIRYRPYKDVINEIEYFKDKYGNAIKIFVLNGECLTIDKQWIINFCKELIKRKLNIKYKVSSRVDTINKEMLCWLGKSGCQVIAFGLESGSDEMLSIMNKKVTVSQNLSAVKMAKKFIPIIEGAIILGHIGETKNTLRDTVRFCKKMGIKPEIYHAFPTPGEKLYDMAIERKFIKDEEDYLMTIIDKDWQKFNINLTEMTFEKASLEIQKAIDSINLYYLIRDCLTLKIIIKIINRIKTMSLELFKEDLKECDHCPLIHIPNEDVHKTGINMPDND